MNQKTPQLSSADILNAFALEPNHDRSTLERYLQNYPQFAIELATLSHDLSRTRKSESELSEKDVVAIDEAWKQYSSSSAVAFINIFAVLSVPKLRELAKFCGVPRQIITAFREQKVIFSTIPQRFLAQLAEGLGTTVDQIRLALTTRKQASCVRSHKSDEKPVEAEPATFEQLLIDAQVPAERRAELMAEGK